MVFAFFPFQVRKKEAVGIGPRNLLFFVSLCLLGHQWLPDQRGSDPLVHGLTISPRFVRALTLRLLKSTKWTAKIWRRWWVSISYVSFEAINQQMMEGDGVSPLRFASTGKVCFFSLLYGSVWEMILCIRRHRVPQRDDHHDFPSSTIYTVICQVSCLLDPNVWSGPMENQIIMMGLIKYAYLGLPNLKSVCPNIQLRPNILV